MASNRASTRQDRVAITEKEIRCVELRTAGLTLDAIAKEVGYANRSSVAEAIKRTLAERQTAATGELRKMEDDRLDHALRLAVEIATTRTNSASSRVSAVETMVSISARRAKLHGLDAPQRRIVDVITRDAFLTLKDQMEGELAALIAEVEAAEQQQS